MSKLLLVDDDAQMRNVLALYLRRTGFTVLDAASLAEGRKLQAKESPDLIILDYQLPDGTAFDFLDNTRERESGEPVIVLTGMGTIDLAVKAIKAGAEHFLTKPVDLESLEVLVRRTLDVQRDRKQRAVSASGRRVDPFIGPSRGMAELRDLAHAVLTSDVPVLIHGETGTGKGVLARWLHEQGRRGPQPFVDLNCAGLSRELAESELFGHHRGAFTGAVSNKPGLIEVAHRGTLFLDEIGDLDQSVQPKLLKALEEGTFRRIGEVAPRTSDFRLLAATHRDIGAMARKGDFREDLLFRINTVTMVVPSLRERAEDIPDVARAVLKELTQRSGRATPDIAEDALRVLVGYPWPGNVRELRNVLERALLFSKGGTIDRAALRFDRTLEPDGGSSGPLTLEDAERHHIERILERTYGKVEEAAKLLDLSRSALYAKLKKYGLKPLGD
jgi:DNA-binding NtrC family response regulator